MNFLTMDYFVMTTKEKSFTKAAEKLHITQQTLSAAISNLEKEIGNQLFVRHVPLELTYAGEVFYRYAETFMRSHADLIHEMEDISRNDKGIIRVGIGNTRGRAVMPGIIDAFQQRYPHYSIEITEGSNAALQKELSDGEIDVAIAVFGEEFPDLDFYPAYQEKTLLIISKEQFQSQIVGRSDLYAKVNAQTILETVRASLLEGDLSAFKNCPFVLGRTADMTRKVANFFMKRSGIEPDIKALSDNIETLIALCERNIGACFCPDNLLYATLSKERLNTLHVFSLSGDAAYDVRFGIRKGNNRRILMDFIEISSKSIHLH